MDDSLFFGLGEARQVAQRTRDREAWDTVAVRLRLRCDPSAVESPELAGTAFGMQTNSGDLVTGSQSADGTYSFKVGAVAKLHRTSGQLRFIGPSIHGPSGEEFLYLNWGKPDGSWARRIKMPLLSLSWERLEDADGRSRVFEFDATGRLPHDRRPVVWEAAER
ncbi:MAG: DUF5990 family protein [Dehalococcoidia bacterium]